MATARTPAPSSTCASSSPASTRTSPTRSCAATRSACSSSRSADPRALAVGRGPVDQQTGHAAVGPLLDDVGEVADAGRVDAIAPQLLDDGLPFAVEDPRRAGAEELVAGAR